jgi:hypothetical protein
MRETGKNGVWTQFKLVWPYYSERREHKLGAGQPDVMVLDKRGAMGEVELKAPDKLDLRKEQWLWHEMVARHKCQIPVVTCERYGRLDIRWAVYVGHFGKRELETMHGADWVDAKNMCFIVARMLKLQVHGANYYG